MLDTSPGPGGCRSIACPTSAAASATTSPSTTTFPSAAPATSAYHVWRGASVFVIGRQTDKTVYFQNQLGGSLGLGA